MQIIGEPVTAKNIADRLGITPSSTKHHLEKLELIGLVELSHTKLINGIAAKYIKLSDVQELIITCYDLYITLWKMES